MLIKLIILILRYKDSANRTKKKELAPFYAEMPPIFAVYHKDSVS